jgi:hypothetical protein
VRGGAPSDEREQRGLRGVPRHQCPEDKALAAAVASAAATLPQDDLRAELQRLHAKVNIVLGLVLGGGLLVGVPAIWLLGRICPFGCCIRDVSPEATPITA